jgi:hypothetical protein
MLINKQSVFIYNLQSVYDENNIYIGYLYSWNLAGELANYNIIGCDNNINVIVTTQ